MAANEDDRYNFLKGFMIGSFLGAITGLLFAPKAGKELRFELKQKGIEAFDEAKEFYSEARVKAKAVLDDAWRRAEELRKEADRQLSEARLKAKEILAGAEEKATEVSKLAKETIEDTKTEVKKVKGAVEAGVEAAKREFSKEEEKSKNKA
jgi:gas vesicle protein